MKTNQPSRQPTIRISTIITLLVLVLLGCSQKVFSQWATNGNNINNTNTGNVGVGTTSPDTNAKLHVYNAPGAGVDIQSANAGGWSRLRLVTGTHTYGWFTGDSTQADAPNKIGLYDYTAGAFRMMIDSSGNVGIGTTSPTAQLHVLGANGPANFTMAPAPDAFQVIGGVGGNGTWGASAGGIGGAINFTGGTGGTPSAGYTTALGGKGGSINLSGGTGGPNTFNVGGGAGGDVLINGGAGVANSAGNVLLGNLRGNVGVGTASPGYRLDVQGGQLNASGGLCIAGDCKSAWSQVGGGASQWTTAGSTIYYSGGNVGIGATSPVFDANAAKYLTVDAGPAAIGSIGAAGGTGSTGTAVSQVAFVNSSLGSTEKRLATIVGSTDTATNSGILDFYTANAGAFSSPKIRITSGGNVGIGTTSPLSTLQVGTQTSTGTPSPATFSLGGTYSNSAGANFKLKLYDDGVTGNTYGIGVSSGSMDFGVSPTGGYNWYSGGANKMTLTGSGTVGIGTATPNSNYKLDVNGNLNASGTITGGNIVAKYQDVAEWVPATHALPAGTVAVLNPNQSNQVMASAQAYDTRVAGVVSERPGLVLGEAGKDKVLVATTGRVRVKVDATRAPIHIGDLLVASDKEGMAMKSQPISIGGVEIHRPGTLIGKALEPLEKGTGEILVLLSLQ